MQRSCVALLLCSIAFVAFAAAATESAAAATKTKAQISSEQALKLLAMDSAAATAAFDQQSVPSVATASSDTKYSRKHKGSKHYKSKSHDDDDYYKKSKKSYGDDSYKNKYEPSEHYGKDSYEHDEYKGSHEYSGGFLPFPA
jgi:hypothetical protein